MKYFPTSRLQVLLENLAFSLDVSHPFEESNDGRALTLRRGSEKLVMRPISGRGEINPEDN